MDGAYVCLPLYEPVNLLSRLGSPAGGAIGTASNAYGPSIGRACGEALSSVVADLRPGACSDAGPDQSSRVLGDGALCKSSVEAMQLQRRKEKSVSL